MSYLYVLTGILLIFIFLSIVTHLTGVKSPCKKAILGMILGILALCAVNLTGKFTGVTLPVSLLSLGISATGGIPAVTMMLLINLILAVPV